VRASHFFFSLRLIFFVSLFAPQSVKSPYKGVTIKKGLSSDNFYRAYAVADVPTDPQSILAFLWGFMIPSRIVFNRKTDLERRDIGTLNSHCKVVYSAKRLPPPLVPRDFVMKFLFIKLDDGRYVFSVKSCTHATITTRQSKEKGEARAGGGEDGAMRSKVTAERLRGAKRRVGF